MNIGIEERRIWHILLLLILIASLWFNLSVTTTEPLVFGDEGYYASRGKALADDLTIFNGFSNEVEITREEPLGNGPMIFLMLGLSFSLFGEIGMKILLPIASTIAALFLFLLVKRIHSVRVGFLSALVYLSVPAVVTHTVFLYAEHLALMFLIISFYFFYRYLEEEGSLYLVLTGIFFGFSALTEKNVVVIPLLFGAVIYLYKRNWGDWYRDFGALSLVIVLVTGSWMIHSYQVGNGIGFGSNRVLESIGASKDPYKIEREAFQVEEGEGFAESRSNRGAIHEEGYIRYIKFTYSIPVFVLAMLGFSLYVLERKKKYVLPILWAVLMFSVTYSMLWNRNMDMVSRNTLYIVAPLAMAAGYSLDKIYKYLKSLVKNGEVLGIIMIIFLLGWSSFAMSAKAESLRPLKSYSGPFFKGCEWVKGNTPNDSLIYYIWSYRSTYHCQRKSIGNEHPLMEGAIVHSDKRTHEAFKEIGIDYVMVQSIHIGVKAREDAYPVEFIQYLSSSEDYEEVYKYPDNCTIGLPRTKCVAIYKVLDDE